jgi:hypothetical protein
MDQTEGDCLLFVDKWSLSFALKMRSIFRINKKLLKKDKFEEIFVSIDSPWLSLIFVEFPLISIKTYHFFKRIFQKSKKK